MWAPQHMRKIFVGGIDYTTTDESLKEHFSQFGEVVDAVVMKDPGTSRSRGFGFVTYMNPENVDDAQKARPHKIDGRLVETKRAVPRQDGQPNVLPAPNHQEGSSHCRVFVGGLPQEVKEADLEEYFGHFGDVICVNIMYDKSSGRHRGFAFVDFNDYDPVDKVILTRNHTIKGRVLDVKKAISKNEISKLKRYMSNVVGNDVIQGINPAMMPIPGGMQTVTSSGTANNGNVGSPTGNGPGNLNQVRGNIPMGIPFPNFMPRIPMGGAPAFSAQLRSGWQYSVSSNAEVLKNTQGATNGEPSGAPKGIVNLNIAGNGNESECSSEEEEEEDVIMEEGSSSLLPPASTSSDWKKTFAAIDICPPDAPILFLEPYFGGSHKQLIQTIRRDEDLLPPGDVAIFTLPSKKWHWKARTSALYFSQKIPIQHNYNVLFCSSVLNLCELISLRPDLRHLKKIIYFHENQLVYPIQSRKDRDFQYGYNQILSALVADVVVFNSQYNLESFLRQLPRHIKLQPGRKADAAPIVEQIKNKSQVLYFPVNIVHKIRTPKDALEPLHILWTHRWEHDKDPETFFNCLYQLAQGGHNFRVSVLGESFSQKPPIFEEAQQKLSNFIVNWGYKENKDSYWEVLHKCDVVVSTAHHEFFGVSMLEAVGAGCYPVCPNRLVYPEIFPQECLYNTTDQLVQALAQWCTKPLQVRSKKVNLDLNAYSWTTLSPQYKKLLSVTA